MSCTSVSLTANVANQTYNLNDGYNIRLLDYELGLAAARRLSQRAPAQFGDTNLGGVTEPRFIDIFWAVWGDTKAEFRTARETFFEVFRNRQNEPVQLVFGFEDGRQRAADVYLDGALSLSDAVDRFERISGVLKASDWRLYDPTLRTVEFALSEDGLPIPFTVPIPIGIDSFDIVTSITYAGSSRLAAVEFPIIIIKGAILDPIVENITTGEIISLAGYSQTDSDTLTIDLSGGARRDSKTIRDQDGNSRANFLTTDSDLGTWHLSYAGELLSDGTYSTGVNEIRVYGASVTVSTTVTIQYYDRYEAI